MAYFKMKCPHCLRSLSNYDIVFKKSASAPMETPVHVETPQVEANTSNSGPRVTRRRQSQSTQQETLGTGDGYTYDQLVAIHGEENVKYEPFKNVTPRPYFQHVDTDEIKEKRRIFYKNNAPQTDEEAFESSLDMNFSPASDRMIQELIYSIEAKNTGEKFTRRFCPCGKELNRLAGTVPTFVVLTLGPSDAGKTMFLITLLEVMGEEQFAIPPSDSGANTIASVNVVATGGEFSDSSDGRRVNLSDLKDDLFNEGLLPPTTIIFNNEPLQLTVNIDFNLQMGSETKRERSSALMFLQDMPGEWLTNTANESSLDRVIDQFPHFDGFIMILDPFTFSGSDEVFVGQVADHELSDSKLKYVRRMTQVLSQKIVPKVNEADGASNEIRKPTAVIITKGDHFLNKSNEGALEDKNIHQSFPTLANDQPRSFDKKYYEEIDEDVNIILDNIAKNVRSMLGNSFAKEQTFFSLISALGKEPPEMEVKERNGIERRYVKNRRSIEPWRVYDPFIRMLMAFKVLPPFNELEIRTPDMETNRQKIARGDSCRNRLSDWGKDYRNDDWIKITNEILTSEQSPLPKGKNKKENTESKPVKKSFIAKLLGR